MTGKANSEKELTIERIFGAPRDTVWRAWTEPERVMRWWGPKGFTSPVCRIDLRVGGRYLFCMRSPEGKDFWSTGTYREILPPRRIVCTDSFADAQGNAVPAAHYGFEGEWPLELLMKVTFEEHEAKTKLRLRHSGFPQGEHMRLAKEGWNSSFDKLAEALEENG